MFFLQLKITFTNRYTYMFTYVYGFNFKYGFFDPLFSSVQMHLLK